MTKFYGPPRYLSWYQQPRLYKPREYLFLNHEGDWEYTRDKNQAFRFASRYEAAATVPGYDGSNNIENRAGVLEVLR